MGDMYSSPADPLFYLHHSALDRIWNLWQRLGTSRDAFVFNILRLTTDPCVDWADRKSDVGGPDTMWAYPFNFFGDVPYTNITLGFQLNYPGMAPSLNISAVMDIQSGPFCYYYQ
jgi:tyrosinase